MREEELVKTDIKGRHKIKRYNVVKDSHIFPV